MRAEFRRKLFMMHRSKKVLGSGEQEYFNEKPLVNGRVDGAAHHTSPSSSGARGMQKGS
jgi:hypothetical protein